MDSGAQELDDRHPSHADDVLLNRLPHGLLSDEEHPPSVGILVVDHGVVRARDHVHPAGPAVLHRDEDDQELAPKRFQQPSQRLAVFPHLVGHPGLCRLFCSYAISRSISDGPILVNVWLHS